MCGSAAEQRRAGLGRTTCSPAPQRSQGSYFGHQCKRLLAVSLRHRDQVLGIYNLFFDADAETGPDITAILRSVGELLGLALHNARIERERLRVTVMQERQKMVNEVHDAMAQTLAYVKMRLPLLHDACCSTTTRARSSISPMSRRR